MSDDIRTQLGNLWNGFKKKTGEAVSAQGANLARGKTVAKDIFDGAGALLVSAGSKVDDATIARVDQAGKMHELVASVVQGQTQDLQERVKTEIERTPDGQEARNLADSELYLEARRYIRYRASVAVTDIRGNDIVPAGKIIEDEDVRAVREAEQLSALIYSAQQSGGPVLETYETSYSPESVAPSPVSTRTPLPLTHTYGEDETV